MGEGKPGSNQSSDTTPAPDRVTAPAGSRADGVSDGANTNFGPTLGSVPRPEPTPDEPADKK